MRDRNAPLTSADIAGLDWGKGGGLIPAVVQDAITQQVLMLGYMNAEALAATQASGFVTFFSRSKNRLWRKGETSGDTLALRAVHADCDGDALLILADPAGPTCHLGTPSCFMESGPQGVGWLGQLARIVAARKDAPTGESYTARLFADGQKRIAQKVGEEGLETALAGAAGDRGECIAETADLIYHLTLLMQARGYGWDDVAAALEARRRA